MRKISYLLLICLWLGLSGFVVPERQAGFINDYTNTLNSRERASLQTKAEDLFQKFQITAVTAIIPSIEDDVIENIAVKIFEAWKPGEKDKNNGILLVIALKERKLRIEVGYGLEGRITDAVSSRIIRQDIAPYFKEAKYYNGILNYYSRLDFLFQNKSEDNVTEEELPEGVRNFFVFIIFILFVIFYFFASIMRRYSTTYSSTGVRRRGWDSINTGWGGWGNGGGGGWGSGGFGGSSGGGGASGDW